MSQSLEWGTKIASLREGRGMSERAQLVEVAALDALDRAERLEPRVGCLEEETLALGVEVRMGDEEIRSAVASRWILDNLGDQSVWLGPSVMDVAASRRNATYRRSLADSVARSSDLADSLVLRGYFVAVDFLRHTGPYITMPKYKIGGDLGFKTRAEWQASIESVARERASEAERNYIASVVRLVAEDVTTRVGFEFWTTHYVRVEYEPDNSDRPYRWKAHPR
jgi:hypothetical protein